MKLFLNSSKRKGFSIIEILVIVAIIGILASVVLIKIIDAKAKARDADFKNLASSINSAILMCCFNGRTI